VAKLGECAIGLGSRVTLSSNGKKDGEKDGKKDVSALAPTQDARKKRQSAESHGRVKDEENSRKTHFRSVERTTSNPFQDGC